MTAYDAREQALEVMARAYYEWAVGEAGEQSRWGEDSLGGIQARMHAGARAIVMLDALLAAKQTQTCETCGGTGRGKAYDCPTHGSHTPSCAGSIGGNPDCSSGVVVGTEPLIILGPERVQGVKQGAAFIRFSEPLFADRHAGSPTDA